MGMSFMKVGIASVWVYTNGGHAPSVSEGNSGYEDTYVCTLPILCSCAPAIVAGDPGGVKKRLSCPLVWSEITGT